MKYTYIDAYIYTYICIIHIPEPIDTKKKNRGYISVDMLTHRRTRRLVGFVWFAFFAEDHHDGRQDDDLIPRYEDGPRERLEGTTLELKRHGASTIDKNVEPDQST